MHPMSVSNRETELRQFTPFEAALTFISPSERLLPDIGDRRWKTVAFTGVTLILLGSVLFLVLFARAQF